jgi:hypothetical protein
VCRNKIQKVRAVGAARDKSASQNVTVCLTAPMRGSKESNYGYIRIQATPEQQVGGGARQTHEKRSPGRKEDGTDICR